MQRILVLRGGALGDFIVTLPALALLRERWPAAEIELIGNATAASLAQRRGLLNAVHSQHEARWSALYGDAPLPKPLADWLTGFDLVVSYWPDPEGELKRRLPVRAGQTFLSAAAMPSLAPAAAHYCEPLRALGLATHHYVFSLVERGAERGLSKAITVHPGSGSARKNWPAERWHELLSGLPGPVTSIVGEAERQHGRLSPLLDARTSDGARVSLLEHRPLEELVSHLSGARLFLGHDSGISHLAAACGAPCVLLFGPTAPEVWAPPAPNVRVIRHGPDLAALPVAAVLDAVAAALADRR